MSLAVQGCTVSVELQGEDEGGNLLQVARRDIRGGHNSVTCTLSNLRFLFIFLFYSVLFSLPNRRFSQLPSMSPSQDVSCELFSLDPVF